jgi:hypothetical protein
MKNSKRVKKTRNPGMQASKKKFPLATIAFYGPDDKLATKIAVGIILKEGEEPEFMKRWYSERTDIRLNQSIFHEINEFISSHNVSNVAMVDRIIGCPHEEGIDYPEGEKCPHCPFWAIRDRWTGEIIH